MNGLPFPPSVLIALAVTMIGGSLILMRLIDREEKMKGRISNVLNPTVPAVVEGGARDGSGRGGAVNVVAQIGAALARSGLLPAATRAEFEQTLSQAGWRGSRGLSLFIGSKVVGMSVMPILVYFGMARGTADPVMFWAEITGSLIGGLLLPDFVLKQMRAAHLKEVERGLPDALDMMVICAQAGLALETAIERVAIEFSAANPAVSQELATCASELRIGADRRTALLAMGERTGLDTMKRFAATLVQTMQFGTPLTHALRVLAAEMRTDMLTKYEEKAARLPVLLTMPMILFILPCVFIVVGGPAGVRISEMFGKK